VRDLKLREADDEQIFFAARKQRSLSSPKTATLLIYWNVMAVRPKSSGSPVATLPNRIETISYNRAPEALRLLDSGDDLVEIGNP